LVLRIKTGVNLEHVESLKILIGQDFEGVNLPETVSVCIINYYANEAGRYKTKQASLVLLAFGAIGFERWVQKSLGWTEPSRETRDDLRLSSTEVRKETMEALSEAGFTKTHHYINVTQMVYKGLFGMNAKQLRESRGLSEKQNIRDHLTTEELGMVRTLELLVKQVLIAKVFTSSADLNSYIHTISQGMKAVGQVDPKKFLK
jgi:hypothetical protein